MYNKKDIKTWLITSIFLSANLVCNAWGLVWGKKDIGNPGIAGSASYDPCTGTWTIEGSGDDIWSESDQFYYVYRPLSGNGSIEVSLESIGVPDDWAKAGVMICETTKSGSKHTIIAITGSIGIQWS